jgi:alkylated DNA repair dioxygenase AlkB
MNIPGLRYVPDFIDKTEEQRLLDAIDAEPWLHDLQRRVQHYGYKYDYRVRRIDRSMFLGPLPAWSSELQTRLRPTLMPDQLIVNEYEPGQGITKHVDCSRCFDDVICSVSLGSSCIMHIDPFDKARRVEVPLAPRSLIVLSLEARYWWRHAIPARKSDVIGGQRTPRSRRVSLTFRKVLPSK